MVFMAWEERYYLSEEKVEMDELDRGNYHTEQDGVMTHLFPNARIYIGEKSAVTVEETGKRRSRGYRNALQTVEKVFGKVSEQEFDDMSGSGWERII